MLLYKAEKFILFLQLESKKTPDLRILINDPDQEDDTKMLATIIVMQRLMRKTDKPDENFDQEEINEMDKLTIQITAMARMNRLYKEEIDRLKSQK